MFFHRFHNDIRLYSNEIPFARVDWNLVPSTESHNRNETLSRHEIIRWKHSIEGMLQFGPISEEFHMSIGIQMRALCVQPSISSGRIRPFTAMTWRGTSISALVSERLANAGARVTLDGD
jgi:hypothetical protein